MKQSFLSKSLCGFFALIFCLTASIFSFGLSAAAATPDLVVEVKNCATVDISISQITNTLSSDPKAVELLKWIKATITIEDKVLYDGLCSDFSSPILDYITLKTGEEKMVNVKMQFLKEAPNTVQGAQFNMQWRFDAKGEIGGNITLSNKTFYFNPNINPGDLMEYNILLKNSGNLSDPVATTTQVQTNPNTNPVDDNNPTIVNTVFDNSGKATLHISKKLVNEAGVEFGTGKKFAVRLYDANGNELQRLILTANQDEVVVEGLKSNSTYYMAEEDGTFTILGYEIPNVGKTTKKAVGFHIPEIADGQTMQVYLIVNNSATEDQLATIPDDDVPLRPFTPPSFSDLDILDIPPLAGPNTGGFVGFVNQYSPTLLVAASIIVILGALISIAVIGVKNKKTHSS